MTEAKSPVRWAQGGDGASPGLQRLMQQAEADRPTEARLRELAHLIGLGAAAGAGVQAATQLAAGTQGAAEAAALGGAAPGATLGAAAPGGALGAALTSTVVSGLGLKTLGVAALLGASGAGYAVWSNASSVPAPVVGQTAPSEHPVAQGSSAPPPETRLEPPKPDALPGLTGAPSAELPDGRSPSATQPERWPPRAPASQRATSAAPKQASTELSLLSAARAALSAHPPRALRLAREHERRFPNGKLRQEREVILIESLRILGKRDEARARGERFEQQYPNSAHKNKVQDSAGP